MKFCEILEWRLNKNLFNPCCRTRVQGEIQIILFKFYFSYPFSPSYMHLPSKLAQFHVWIVGFPDQ
jgi:hypothetical protein